MKNIIHEPFVKGERKEVVIYYKQGQIELLQNLTPQLWIASFINKLKYKCVLLNTCVFVFVNSLLSSQGSDSANGLEQL